MTAPEFDPALLGRAAYAVERAERRKNATYEDVALAVLVVVAPDLLAEGARKALADLEKTVADWGLYSRSGGGVPYIDGVQNTLSAAREAVARVEGGA